MFRLSILCLFYIFAILCFVVLCFVIDPVLIRANMVSKKVIFTFLIRLIVIFVKTYNQLHVH